MPRPSALVQPPGQRTVAAPGRSSDSLLRWFVALPPIEDRVEDVQGETGERQVPADSGREFPSCLHLARITSDSGLLPCGELNHELGSPTEKPLSVCVVILDRRMDRLSPRQRSSSGPALLGTSAAR